MFLSWTWEHPLEPNNCFLADSTRPWHPLINPYLPIINPVFYFLPEHMPWLLKRPHLKGRQGPWRASQGRIVALGPTFWSAYIDMNGQDKMRVLVTVYCCPHPGPGPTKEVMVPVGSDYVYFPSGGWKDFVMVPPRPSKSAKKYLP